MLPAVGQANYSASNSLLDSLAAFWSCQAYGFSRKKVGPKSFGWWHSWMTWVCLRMFKVMFIFFPGDLSKSKMSPQTISAAGSCRCLVAQCSIRAVGSMGGSGHGSSSQHLGTSQVYGCRCCHQLAGPGHYEQHLGFFWLHGLEVERVPSF